MDHINWCDCSYHEVNSPQAALRIHHLELFSLYMIWYVSANDNERENRAFLLCTGKERLVGARMPTSPSHIA